MKTVLELCSGYASFGTEAKKYGYDLLTIDYDSYFNPDICSDLFYIEKDDLPLRFQTPDIIWASPDCTYFSVANIGRSWGGGYRKYMPKTKETETAMALLAKVIILIDELKPKYWFIENPRGVMRKMCFMNEPTNLITNVPLNELRNEVCYCQYGDKRMKPTDIWTNLIWESRPMCYNGCSDHEMALRGMPTGTQGLEKRDRSRIPSKLCIEILETIELMKENQVV